jgi:SAM-dependent methyltransferase
MVTQANAWGQVAAPADYYERDLVPALFEPWARDLVERVGTGPGERVLDVASGTGVVARIAAARVGPSGSVTALDVNPTMVEVGKQVCGAVRPAIEWRLASAEDTGLPDASYDLVFCQQGLQFVPDRSAAVRELHRVTVPGGRVAVSTWCDLEHSGFAPFPAAFARHIPDLPEPPAFVRTIFGLSDAAELERLLTAAGFREIRIGQRSGTVRYPSAAAWARTFLSASPVVAVAAVDAAVRERIVDEAAEALGGGDGFAFPMTAHVAVAQR